MSGDLVFYGFAALTVLSGFVVVFARNIVHAGFALLFTLLGVAGLYALLGADFLAVTQTVVYIGGILVLVLFAVMMTRIPRKEQRRRGLDHMVPAGIFSLGLFALLYKVSAGSFPVREPGEAVPTVKAIGVEIMTDWIFPFEFASLVLLVAMVGAAILIRERRPARAPEALPENAPGETAEAPEEVHA
ncbi:NADH-quinone oxidoreductase subunit J [bacterium]|nr:NADH-quinone oxidoreductase subunit J [bacterium]HPF36710.1 NADH-quinone oxidoreductase subunit J [Candidatus Krumholzibacteria bacterium]HRX52549.1 NADH-quinone oxidoreductase subunit J [Candidatus Krumholzibacteria bacterium]